MNRIRLIILLQIFSVNTFANPCNEILITNLLRPQEVHYVTKANQIAGDYDDVKMSRGKLFEVRGATTAITKAFEFDNGGLIIIDDYGPQVRVRYGQRQMDPGLFRARQNQMKESFNKRAWNLRNQLDLETSQTIATYNSGNELNQELADILIINNHDTSKNIEQFIKLLADDFRNIK